ncbi:MAG: amidohydrolase family protein [Rhodospirillaceae bacterium]|nr:amidohydrolase family protein [Rhodospirillaceae bacterium]
MSDRAGSIDTLEAALPRMEKLGWSLVLHVEPDHFVDNEKIIRNIPIPTIVDHMARCKPSDGGMEHPAFGLLLDLLKDDRFWAKIASVDKISGLKQAYVPDGMPYTDVIPMGEAVIAAAPDRIIWGSDWPHGNTFEPGRIPNDGDLLNVLGAMAPDDDQRRKILVDNPTRLYFG